MQQTQIAINPKLYEKLVAEAKRHRLNISDWLQMLVEDKKDLAGKKTGTQLFHDLLSISPQYRGPQNLSTTYEGLLYGNP